jgi:hypothetical protein
MNKTIKTPEGEFDLEYFRPEAEPRAVQVEGYFYPANSDDEIELGEFTFYGEPSIENALADYMSRAKRIIKGKVGA